MTTLSEITITTAAALAADQPPPTEAMKASSRQLYNALRDLWAYVSMPDSDDEFVEIKADTLAAIAAAEASPNEAP